MFKTRQEAGRVLAERLIAYRDQKDAVVLALPRGGVAVAYPISLALHLPLDVFITRKLGAPGNPEYAIGAVAETGMVHLNPGSQEVLQSLGATSGYLEQAIAAQRMEITRRQSLYRRGRPIPAVSGRTVILVDDGIATGATFLASVSALRGRAPARLVAALPVGPSDTLAEVRRQVDELVVLLQPETLFAVGNHFVDFTQVEDEAVIRYLDAAAEALRGGHPATRT